MKNLYNYLYEGILSGIGSITSDIEDYAENVVWIKKHLENMYGSLEDNEFDVVYDDNHKLSLVGKPDPDMHLTLELQFGLDEGNVSIPSINCIPKINGSEYYNTVTSVKIYNDCNIKDFDNLVDFFCSNSIDVIFTRCSAKYTNDIINKFLKSSFKDRLYTVSITDPTESEIDFDKFPKFKLEGENQPYIKQLFCPDTIVSYTPVGDQNGFFFIPAAGFANDNINCKEFIIKGTKFNRLDVDCAKIGKLTIADLNPEDMIQIRCRKSKIGNMKELLETYGDTVEFDSATKNLCKLKPEDFKQYDAIGQQLSIGDYVLSPVFNSHGAWGNSGLRLMCSQVKSMSGMTINNGYKNISSKDVLKVPETTDLRTDLQEENKSLNGYDLKVGDVVAYCDTRNARYNTNAYVCIDRIEKMGKTITINSRRTYPNMVYKIDTAWLKKMDANKLYKKFY